MIPEQPPISTAVLKSYLMYNNIKNVVTLDLSLDFFYYLLERMRISEEFDAFTVMGLKIAALDYLNNILEFDLETFSYKRITSKNEVSHWAAPMPFSYSELLSLLETNPSCLDEFLDDTKKNIYVRYIEEKIQLNSFGFKDGDFFGFSIIGFFQVIPTLTIAKCLKRHFPNCKICFGGPWVTLYVNELPSLFSSKMSNYVDFFSFAEGEESLVKIIEYIHGDCKIEEIPNALIRYNGDYVNSNLFSIFNVNTYSSPPDYTDFHLDKYLSFIEGEGRISVQSSRGCYHNKCSFCNALTNLQCKKLRQKSLDCFFSEIEILIKRHPTVKVFDFADSVSSKQRLILLSDLFQKYDLSWEIDIRLEKWVDDELIDSVKKSRGLLRFGLESVSQRLLDLHQKGNDMTVVNAIMERCKRHNYKPFIMTIVGLPSETANEAFQLRDFLVSNIHYCYPLVEDFNLEKNTDIFYNPATYGIIINKPDSIFVPHLSFIRMSGYSSSEERIVYEKVFMDVMHSLYEKQLVDADSFEWKHVDFELVVDDSFAFIMHGCYNGKPFQGLNPHFKQALYSNGMFLNNEAAVVFN